MIGWLLAYEAVHAAIRNGERFDLYNRARARAEATGRQLVVIGDPAAGAYTRIFAGYSCGDVTVDLHGAPSCPVQLAADITRPGSIPGPAVVYVACVLEYVEDIEAAWREIMRAAGSPENVFVVRVSPWCATSRLFPGARWVLHQAPPDGPLSYSPTGRWIAGDGN